MCVCCHVRGGGGVCLLPGRGGGGVCMLPGKVW